MNALTADQVQSLLEPYAGVPLPACERVVQYLAVFSVWSGRMNLSTVRDPQQIVERHFGEGFAMAGALPAFRTLLDLGSGAGFPGLPLAIAHPGAAVTLAESQGKKAAFLKEATWMMGLRAKVWADRAEKLPTGTRFDVVTLRAVDKMTLALKAGVELLAPGGTLAFFVGQQEALALPEANWGTVQTLDVPKSSGHMVLARLAS